MRAERSGLPGFPRLGFYPEQAVAQLKGASHVLLAGAHEPVVLGFAYLGQPSSPVPADAAMVTLAAPAEDAARALTDLAAIIAPGTAATVAAAAVPAMPSGPLTLQSWPRVLAALLPEDAIIVDESISSGQAVPAATAGAPRHDLLTLTGTAMGMGLPLAAGAAQTPSIMSGSQPSICGMPSLLAFDPAAAEVPDRYRLGGDVVHHPVAADAQPPPVR